MRRRDVPQDGGMNEGLREITYAVDDDGRYVGVPSAGWEPKTIANAQAWEVIDEEVRAQARLVREGRRSPLAYHLARHMMSIGLAADYVGIARWRVKRHLKPKVFAKLKPDMLKRYADLFGLGIAELREVPDPEADGPAR